MASQPAPDASSPHGTSTGLDPKLASLLAYLFGWVSGLVLYLVEKDHAEVRFHAAQSVLLSIAVLAVYVPLMILGFVPVIGLIAWLLSLLLAVASVGLWLYLLVQGWSLNHVRLPLVGPVADQWASR